MKRLNLALVLCGALWAGNTSAAGPTVIELTQVPCQFLEVEEKDFGYTAKNADACREINKGSTQQRLAKSRILKLKPGKHIFRVTNKSVPYELGFYLRAAQLTDRWSLPKVSGGGILTGTSKDYSIDLKPGEYLFSCPLNPTPDYRVIVSEQG